MEKRKIIYIISGILIVIIVGYLSWILYHVFSSFNYNDKYYTYAKVTLYRHMIYVNDDGTKYENYVGLSSSDGSVLGMSSVSFYVEPLANGNVDVSFYEDPELSIPWKENSSKYFKLDSECLIDSNSPKHITEVTLKKEIIKTNTTGVESIEHVYVKITGKPYYK